MKLEIHASALDDFADCALRGAAKLLKKAFKDCGYDIKDLTKYVTPIVGSAIHKGVAEMHFGKALDDCIKAGQDEFRHLRTKEGSTVFTSAFSDDNVIDKHIQDYIIFYHQNLFDKLKAKLNEKNFTYTINEDITMNSTIDRYTTVDYLRDLKTGQQVMPAFNQLGMYLFLLQANGHTPVGVMLDYIQRPKYGGDIFHLPVTYKVKDCLETSKRTVSRLIHDFTSFSKTNNSKIFLTNPRSASCNSRLCPLYGTKTCPSWDKTK